MGAPAAPLTPPPSAFSRPDQPASPPKHSASMEKNVTLQKVVKSAKFSDGLVRGLRGTVKVLER